MPVSHNISGEYGLAVVHCTTSVVLVYQYQLQKYPLRSTAYLGKDNFNYLLRLIMRYLDSHDEDRTLITLNFVDCHLPFSARPSLSQ